MSDWKKFSIAVAIFAVIVVLLITHAKTGLTIATVGVLAAILTLATNKAPAHLIKRVDWQTVLFFIGLFLAVSGLEESGVLEAMAHGVGALTGGSMAMMIIVIIWLSAIASANVAGTSIAARAGHSISWGRYCKYSAPAAVIVIAVSMAMLLMRV